MAELSLQHLEKVYDNNVQAVYDFNLDVKDGELIVLVGPSGCGKSTTLRMVAGLEDITRGKMLLDGLHPDPEEVKPGVGFAALMLQGVATSIDALSVGFTIAEYELGAAALAAAIIAAVTVAICYVGLIIGKTVGNRIAGKASIFGGVILIAIGIEIFVTGVFF